MSGSEHGRDVHNGEEQVTIRSASPAKRTAKEMEGNTQLPSPKSDDIRDDVSQIRSRTIAASIEDSDHMDIQADTAPSSKTVSLADTAATSNTAATSFEIEHSALVDQAGMPSLDEQVRKVRELTQKPLEVGERGVVVSTSWLARVLSRTSENISSLDFPKEAREGDVGPFDNTDIVPSDAFSGTILKDTQGAPFIPLKPGLTIGREIEVLPYEAYGLIVGWHGNLSGQKAIIRYAVDSAPPGASQPNIIYELYPPIFTIKKVPFSSVSSSDSVKDKSRQSVIALRERMERRSRGQSSADDALRIVSSRCEKYQLFLRRTKEYAGIPAKTKVKTWRSLKPAVVQASTTGEIASTAINAPPKMIIDASSWEKLESGKDIEEVDVKDQSSDDNYNGKSTMEMFALFEDQVLILEEQQPSSNDQKTAVFSTKTTLPQSASTSRRNSPAQKNGMITRGRALRNGRTRGTVGLQNLGNTCYMNSALQCIRSVEELAIYFLESKHKQEINAGNPLGYKGAVASRYAEVIRAIYNESAGSSYSPAAFKRLLGQVMPTFSGFGQQDSQEFLSFLVDALHEDLNRIEKKPYFENPDSDDARVNDPAYLIELGETYRSNHRARNDSIAMDLFSGFYKNTMECPTCDKISVTFDPYSLLTLQLPVTNTVTHAFIYVPLTGVPVVHDMDVEKNATIWDIKQVIASKHDGVNAAKLWVAEVYSQKLYKVFADSATFSESGIGAKDHIFVFELEYLPTYPAEKERNSYSGNRQSPVPEMDDKQADILTVPIFHRASFRNSGYSLHPQYISLTREEAKDFDVIQRKVLSAVAQFTSRKVVDEIDESDTEEDDSDAMALGRRDESDATDAAQVSDHSVPSEDEYVNITVDGAADGNTLSNGEVSSTLNRTTSHTIADQHKKQLFQIKYVYRGELYISKVSV